MAHEIALQMTNIRFGYEKTTNVVKDVSFAIPAGSYVAIIGHNGSGKSTLAKLAIGLLEAQAGTISIFGEQLTIENVAQLRKRMGIVFQNPDNQFIGSTVQDDIAFGLENRQIPHDQMQPIINEVATEVNMLPFLEKEPTNLSGGQKQRVAIAGVLAMRPDIIIFDEATAMLDPQGRREIRELIVDMRKKLPNLTVISITHDIEEAYNSDEIIVLNEGKIILSGKPDEVFKHGDVLLNINLDLPFIYKVKEALKKEGIDLGDIANADQLVEKLCQ